MKLNKRKIVRQLRRIIKSYSIRYYKWKMTVFTIYPDGQGYIKWIYRDDLGTNRRKRMMEIPLFKINKRNKVIENLPPRML